MKAKKMLAIILAPIWFGYRANRAGRNPIGWGALGIVAFIALKGIVFAISSNARPSTQAEATGLTVILNTILFGGLFVLGFLIPSVNKGTAVAQSSASTEPGPTTSATGDWECPQCHAMNRSDIERCLSCSTKRFATK